MVVFVLKQFNQERGIKEVSINVKHRKTLFNDVKTRLTAFNEIRTFQNILNVFIKLNKVKLFKNSRFFDYIKLTIRKITL